MIMIYSCKQQVEEVKLIDSFTGDDANQIEEEIDFIIHRGNSKLMIDMTELKSIDIKAAGFLFNCLKKTKRLDGGLVLINPGKKVRSVLKKLRLTDVFSVFFSRANAIKSLA